MGDSCAVCFADAESQTQSQTETQTKTLRRKLRPESFDYLISILTQAVFGRSAVSLLTH